MQDLTIDEINRKLTIWNRMANEKQMMTIAGGLISDVLKELKEAKTKKTVV